MLLAALLVLGSRAPPLGVGPRAPHALRQRVSLADGPPLPPTEGDAGNIDPSRRGVGQGALLVGTSFYLGGLLGEVGDQEVMEALKHKRLALEVPSRNTAPPLPAVTSAVGAAASSQAAQAAGNASGGKLPVGLIVLSSILTYAIGLVSAPSVLRFVRQLLGAQPEPAPADAAEPRGWAGRAPAPATAAAQRINASAAAAAAATTAPVARASATTLPSPPPSRETARFGRKERGKLRVVFPVPTRRELQAGAAVGALVVLVIATPVGTALLGVYSRTLAHAVALLIAQLGRLASALASAASATAGAGAALAAPAIWFVASATERLVSAWALLLVTLISVCKGLAELGVALYAPIFDAIATALMAAWGAAWSAIASTCALLGAGAQFGGGALLKGAADAAVVGLAVRDATFAALLSACLAAASAAKACGVALGWVGAQLLPVLHAAAASLSAAVVMLSRVGMAGAIASGSAAKAGALAAIDAVRAASELAQASAPVLAAKAGVAVGAAAARTAEASSTMASGAAVLAGAMASGAAKLAAAAAPVLSSLVDALGATIQLSADGAVVALARLAQLLIALASSAMVAMTAAAAKLSSALGALLAAAQQLGGVVLKLLAGMTLRPQ
ncbi:hypothetical protein KFE25_000471 [Diacronema lutheri]|uniref:Uncharacterized protein n=2 Tax=Diacronema lutheri TaxID=2081491 RepID=A0A8J5XXC3_DIALT|nr:hypothetical protein KFE25_000471 [Diacronema lutheri]